MRLRLPRIITGFCFLLLFIFVWVFFKFITRHNFTMTCHFSEEFHDKLHKLADKVHHTLKTLELTHFLCYESLWGQLRLSRSLPWEPLVEMCILNEEISLKDEVFLSRTFKKHNMQLDYDSSEGKYSIKDSTSPGAMVFLIVFEKDPIVGMYKRIGWKRRVLPPDCESFPMLDCFPPRLIRPPLPKREFASYVFPVPREGIEIQKYHYPDNWWKEILPKNC